MPGEKVILLVEDDEAIAELEKRILARAGWSVKTVHRVKDAVELLRDQTFAAIVLDYRLPDGEPWTVVDAANAKLPRLPVIMVTAMGNEGIAAEALHRGVSDYVKKTGEFWKELPAAVTRVTDAAVAQQSLHLGDALFQLIAGNLSDMILVSDLEGRVRYVSPACQYILGYQPHELKAILSFDLVHPDDREDVRQRLGTLRQQGQGSLICRVREKLGHFRWIESNMNIVRDPVTGVPELIAISRDVTERKAAEEEIRNLNAMLASRVEELDSASAALVAACQRAEEGNRAKSDFLAAMSHEIRTPMNAILGMTDLLKETELDPVQQDYIDRCRRAGANLLTLINDILDLSKIESGRFDLEQVSFDLEELVERTVEMIAPRAHLKGVGLFARVAPEAALCLIGDPVRLQQILINLLGNAVKFTESGEIVLTVIPENGSDPAHLRFEVSDTGIGIPPDKLGAIFEDFTQAESSTTRRFGGTGLGLGIARRLVNRMSGELTVSSVVGQGSTFSFNALFSLSDSPLPAETPQETQDLAGRRVLVVDNNATNRLILSKMCLGWGMLPAEANSAAEASALVRSALHEESAFSLVLLDVLMPHVDGFETLAIIRSISPETPVIMTTSNNQSGDATKAKAMGAAAFAVKPVRRSELLRLISSAVRPAERAEEKATSANAAVQPPARILVAEDSDDNRFLLEAYLNRQPYALHFVENGKDAVSLFEEHPFDLVLMDVQMPVMDGLEATRQIRAFEQRTDRSATPILALTANALLEDVARSHAAGCDSHLSKPISKEKLIAAIESFRFASVGSA
jgi:PAS domain S-box-containing protein